MRCAIDKNIPLGAEAFSTIADVVPLETYTITAASVREADLLIVRSETKVTPALLEGSRVRFVGTATIGTDHIDTAWLAGHGIGFASAPGSNANSVCEYITAALLELGARQGIALKDVALGIVGVGNIGSRVEQAAAALGMHVLLNDPPLQRATGERKYRPLREVMEADIITLHVPLSRGGQDPTFHLFDAGRIAAMKQGAFLMNASRGAVVETRGLYESLRRRQLGGAVLDVWESEPAIDMELLGLTALGTPHIAGYSLDGKLNALRRIYAAACDHLKLMPAWSTPAERLPRPDVPHIQVPDDAPSDDATLRRIVRQCYDICRDDAALRALQGLEPAQRPQAFAALRTGYRIRREFSATQLEGGSPALRGTAARLGFAVRQGAQDPQPGR